MQCCLQHRAPGYIAKYCVPVYEVPGHQHLRSTRRYQLLVPHELDAAPLGHVLFL